MQNSNLQQASQQQSQQFHFQQYPPALAQQYQQQQPVSQYGNPPAPTFASLGGNSLNFTGTLGSLAQVQHSQSLQGAQGLSAAIPPTAYLMQPAPHIQHHQPAQQPAAEKKSTAKREDANFGLILPLHKVKRLIKSESSVKAVSGEASFSIARATELVLEQLVQRAYERMVAENRTTVEYDDIAAAVAKWPATDFLRDIVPEATTLNELIERVKRQDRATKPAALKEG